MIAAVAVGVALRFVHLGEAPLWFDEMYTQMSLALPWHGFVANALRDNQAPIYYVATKAWVALVGSSPWALRVPGLVASAACIPLAAGVARLSAGDRAARTVAWLVAISPYLVQHAQDARPYALLAALATGNLLLLMRYLTGRAGHLGFWWVLTAFAVVATHFYGIFFVAGEGLALLILHPQPIRRWLPAGVVAGGLCCSLVLIAVRYASGIFSADYVFGVTAMPGVVWSLLTGYTLMPTSEELHLLGPSAVLPSLPLAVAVLPTFLIAAAAGIGALRREARVALLTSFGVALLVPFVYRFVAGAGVHPRYFAAAVAPVLIVTGTGMAASRLRGAAGIAAAILAGVMGWATYLHLSDTTHGREDLRAAGRWLDANVPRDEEIVITSREMEILAKFTWPDRRFRLYPDDDSVSPERIPDLVQRFPFADRPRSIFLVGRAWTTDRDGKLQSALTASYATCPGADVRGIRIFCFEPRTTTVTAANR